MIKRWQLAAMLTGGYRMWDGWGWRQVDGWLGVRVSDIVTDPRREVAERGWGLEHLLGRRWGFQYLPRGEGGAGLDHLEGG